MYHRTKDELIGLTTSNGIEIKDVSIHLTTRIFGHMWHENNPKVRRGVTIEKIKETLTNPQTKISEAETREYGKSQKFTFEGTKVSVGVETGRVIQVNVDVKSEKK